MTRIGSLCTGYGGLDQAAEALTGGTTSWLCEFNADASRLLAARYPGVPNFGDLKALAWADHPVDVLTAGYPCQPFSGAGKRLGTDDPRHLFPFIARGVERMRPPLLLLENVRGHLSLGFDVVLAELDRIGYDARWTLLRAADVGAPHGRSRLWIAARDRQVGGWATPTGEPTALVEDGEWVSPHGGLFGSIPATLPGTAGTMTAGARWDSSEQEARVGLLLFPTPNAAKAGSDMTLTCSGDGRETPNKLGWAVSDLLFKTPTAQLAVNGGSQHPDKRKEGGHGPTLADEVEHLLPTPMARDWKGYGPSDMQRNDPNLSALPVLLPTPKASDGEKGGPNQRFGSGSLTLPSAVQPSAWGPYAAAVARWESISRPAPAPTEGRWVKVKDCQECGAPDWFHHYSACHGVWRKWTERLSPAFVEWMMGLPSGWVTDPALGLKRNAQLTLLGNGVVPQAAAAAFGLLLADLRMAVAA